MAKSNTNFQDKFSSFKDRIQTEKPAMPMQTVSPVKAKEAIKEQEVQFGVQLPKSLIKKLKLFALENDKSMKEVLVEALRNHIDEPL